MDVSMQQTFCLKKHSFSQGTFLFKTIVGDQHYKVTLWIKMFSKIQSL